MIRATFVGAVIALACACASAGNTEVKFSDIQITSSAQNVQFVGGTLKAQLAVGGISAPSDSVSNTTTNFTTWPTDLSMSISGHGASAGVSLGPSFLDVWGDSGLYGAYSAQVGLALNFITAPIADDVPFAQTLSVMTTAFAQIGAYFDPTGIIQGALGVTGYGVTGGLPTLLELWGPYKFVGGDAPGWLNWDMTTTADGYQYVFNTTGVGWITARFSRDGHGTVEFTTTMYGRGPGEVVTPVPEPGTYAMMLVGLAAVGFIAKRRGTK